jgi:transposase
VIKKVLPQAMLTADRFHVERLGKMALDKIRTVVQNEGRGSHKNISNYIAKVTLTFLPLSFILNYHTV